MNVKDAGAENTFLYFQKFCETTILYKLKAEIRIQQGHSDVPASRYAVAVTSTPEKQYAGESCYDRSPFFLSRFRFHLTMECSVLSWDHICFRNLGTKLAPDSNIHKNFTARYSLN